MYVLMEEFTNLGNYPKPVDTTLVKNVIAENDAYIVRSGTPSLQELWPGSNVEVSKRNFLSSFSSYLGRCFVALKKECKSGVTA